MCVYTQTCHFVRSSFHGPYSGLSLRSEDLIPEWYTLVFIPQTTELSAIQEFHECNIPGIEFE